MTRAVLFDLGNTLVGYYRAPDFPPILRECLRYAAGVLQERTIDLDSLFERALELNREADNLSVRPLAERILQLFPSALGGDPVTMDRTCRALMQPIFSTARIADGALQVPDELRTRGFRLAVVSNTPSGYPGQKRLTVRPRGACLAFTRCSPCAAMSN
jgi:FMN phosphatase YigB (HAD superfamily)